MVESAETAGLTAEKAGKRYILAVRAANFRGLQGP